MRISRRTSAGRGEYEISENLGGFGPRDLHGSRLSFQFGDELVIDTATQVVGQGGKTRLRLVGSGGMQVPRQLAAALLMPHPVRSRDRAGGGRPILKTDEYSVEDIEFLSVDRVGGAIIFGVREITVSNYDHAAEELRYSDRLAQVQHIWQHAGDLPEELATLIVEHRELIEGGGPIPVRAESLVAELQSRLTELQGDLGIAYRTTPMDPLPDLLRALEFVRVPPPPPIEISEIPPEEVVIRRRTVREWRQWASTRGPASAVFRRQVRSAYDFTCVVCGAYYPATSFNPVPGVDAAHILPWAEYDMDHPSNGLCLCRQHHWAFDQALIVIRPDAGGYVIEVPDDVRAGVPREEPGFSLDDLTRYAGRIDEGRLPRDPRSRPNPRFLEQLNQTLDEG